MRKFENVHGKLTINISGVGGKGGSAPSKKDAEDRQESIYSPTVL